MQYVRDILRKIKPDEEVTLTPCLIRKKILVIGAQTAAGSKIALELSKEQHKIGLAYESNQEILNGISAEMIEKGAEVNLFEFAAGNEDSIRDVVLAVANQFDGIDTLIICSEESAKDEQIDVDDIQKMIDVVMNINYFTAVQFTFFSIPFLRKARGKIIFLSTLNLNQVETSPLFYAAKTATNTFFQTLQEEESGLQIIIVNGNNSHPLEIGKDGHHQECKLPAPDVSDSVQKIVTASK